MTQEQNIKQVYDTLYPRYRVMRMLTENGIITATFDRNQVQKKSKEYTINVIKNLTQELGYTPTIKQLQTLFGYTYQYTSQLRRTATKQLKQEQTNPC